MAMALGESLRALRKNAGKSQYTLAGELGVTQPTISNVERGHAVTTTRVLETWAEACGYEVAFIPADDSLAKELGELDPSGRALVAKFVAALPHLTARERRVWAAELDLIEEDTARR